MDKRNGIFSEPDNSEQLSAERTQWHPAFCSAMRLELRENKQDLDYSNEYNLSQKPLQIDLLVIKKQDDRVIANDIGRIFRRHNIMEFKSPRDGLNIDDFYKVLGYACLYKASGSYVDAIRSEEITISLVRDRKPTGLIAELERRGMTAREYVKGIYYIENHWFLLQLIVTSELSRKDHLWLAVLTEHLSRDGVEALLRETSRLKEKDERELADAVLTVSVSANKRMYDRMKEDADMFEVFKELMAPELQAQWEDGCAAGEARGEARGEAKGEARLARLMKTLLEQGRQDEIVRATVSASDRQQMYEEYNIE